jgi:hypothetical protein
MTPYKLRSDQLSIRQGLAPSERTHFGAFSGKVDTGFPSENATTKEEIERFPIPPDRESALEGAMGWKTQTMLVRPGLLDGGPDQLLADLGYARRRKIEDAPLLTAGAGSIWIGSIGDCIILDTPHAWDFFDEARAEAEDFLFFKNALLRQFPDAEIAALALHSVVDGWCFAIFRRGTLIRRQYGYDGMTLCDEGPRLPIEDAFFSKFRRIETDGEIKYADPAHPEYDEMGLPDLGEPLIFEICRSFTGAPLDRLNPQGTSFWLNDDEAKHAAARARTPAAPARPWWKFWR